MTVAELRGLPVNLRNRMGREVLEEIEKDYRNRRRDEIDATIDAAEAHVAPKARVQAVARLN